jgi:hypothetical protein
MSLSSNEVHVTLPISFGKLDLVTVVPCDVVDPGTAPAI